MPAKKRKRKRKSRYQRGEYISLKTGMLCKFRSGWEHKYMIYLDGLSCVKFWTYEQTVIEYISNLKTKKVRKYYPDFFIQYDDGKLELVEIKPKRKLQQAVVVKKATAAQQWCSEHGMTYRILTEIELKNIGLI